MSSPLHKLVIIFTISTLPFAQSNSDPTEESLKASVEEGYLAWSERRTEDIDPGYSRGFGFRAKSPRSSNDKVPDVIEDWTRKKFLARWLDQMENYRTYIENMRFEIDGNVGMMWGFHIEEFKRKGKPPEKVRVRSSATYLYDPESNKWRTLLSHRDIQVFDDSGEYVPTWD